MKTKRFKISTTQYSEKFGELTIEAAGTITSVREGSNYNRAGDPGDDTEESTIHFEEIVVTDSEGETVVWDVDISSLEEIATDQAYIVSYSEDL